MSPALYEEPATVVLARKLAADGLAPLCFGLGNDPVFARYAQRHETHASGGITGELSFGWNARADLPQVWVPRWVAALLLVSPAMLCDGGRPNRAGARVVRLLRRMEAEPALREALLSALALGGTEGADVFVRGLR